MRTLAVTSGKGGVGKTNLAVNLGFALATLDRRVVVIDGDIGLANLDVVLGVRPPHTLQHVLSGEVKLEQALFCAFQRIRVLAGGSGAETLVTLNGAKADRFLQQVQALSTSVDELIIDTGAGIDENVMLFLQAADTSILVATPDPSSLTDAYATAKALIMKLPEADVAVVVNMIDNPTQGRAVFDRLDAVANQFLRRRLRYLGHVRFDQRALGHIRGRRPFFAAEPGSPASQDVLGLARRLTGSAMPDRTGLADRLRSLFSKAA